MKIYDVNLANQNDVLITKNNTVYYYLTDNKVTYQGKIIKLKDVIDLIVEVKRNGKTIAYREGDELICK